MAQKSTDQFVADLFGSVLGDGPSPATPEQKASEPDARAELPGLEPGFLDDVLAEALGESERRARVAQEATRKAEQVIQGQRESAEAYAASAQAVLQEGQAIDQDRKQAQQLAESASFLDRLELIGGQILEPKKYTHEARDQKKRELSTTLALHGQVHNVESRAAEARLAEIEAEMRIKAYKGETALDRMKTKLEVLQTARATAQETETLRGIHLSQQPLEAIRTAATQEPDQFGYIQMGDFRYTPDELATREKQVATQRLLNSLPTTGWSEPQLAAYQQHLLDQMSIGDLRELQKGNYNHNGMSFRSDLVDTALANATQRQVDQVERQWAITNTESDTLRQELESSITRIERLKNENPPNTLQGEAVRQWEQRLSVITAFSESEEAQTTAGRMKQLQMISAAEADYLNTTQKIAEEEAAAIEERNAKLMGEAKSRSGGDKALVPIIHRRLQGLDPDPTQIFSYAQERFIDGRTFAQAVNPADASELYQSAEAIYNGLVTESADPNTGLNNLTVTEQKRLRAQAFSLAWETLADKKAIEASLGAVSWSLTANLEAAGLPPNPLFKAGVTQGDYSRMIAEADKIAAQRVMAEADIDEQTWVAIRNGRENEVEVSTEKAEELRSLFNAGLVFATYDQIERVKPGLGAAYTDWLTKNLIPVTERVMKNRGGVSQFFAERGKETAGISISLWSAADEGATKRQQQLAAEHAMRLGEPETVLPAAIRGIKDVTDAHKKQVMDQIIEPTIATARKEGLNDDETLARVMAALEEGEYPTALANAAKKILRALPSTIRAVEDTHTTVMERIMNGTWRAGLAPLLGPLAPAILPDDPNAGKPTIRQWRNQQ